jgi:hypothetical protein
MMIISPYTKPHFISHETYDHASILRFIEWMFNLPALTRRDANATPPLEMLDFSTVSFPQGCKELVDLFAVEPTVDADEKDYGDKVFKVG